MDTWKKKMEFQKLEKEKKIENSSCEYMRKKNVIWIQIHIAMCYPVG